MIAGWHCRPACRDRQLSPSALAPGLSRETGNKRQRRGRPQRQPRCARGRRVHPRASHPREYSDPDGRIHYVDEGDGPLIILVHGTPTWSMEWRHVINALRPQFRVLAVDHLGFGLSERPKGVAYTPEARDPALRPQINQAECRLLRRSLCHAAEPGQRTDECRVGNEGRHVTAVHSGWLARSTAPRRGASVRRVWPLAA